MNARDSLNTAINSDPAVIHRQDYQPPSHHISCVRLDFTLGVQTTRVINEFAFQERRETAPPGSSGTLTLQGDELEFVQVWCDGEPLADHQIDASPSHLKLRDLPPSGVLKIETRISPVANTALMGLYASRGGLFTQCESEGFRRITYFLDRPDVMAVYDVVMRGPKHEFPVMLSNGNLIEQRDLVGDEVAQLGGWNSTNGTNGLNDADGANAADTANGTNTATGEWHQAHWQDPFPKPSYLFALVAADLERIEETIITQSGRQALLQVYTRKSDLSQAGFALQSLKRAIFWDEKRYGLELDLERFMIVAVPDFNSGAMENKGLNLFNTKFVLADANTATDVDFDGIESVVAHEYFHNWTGNRITCRDWFQLTLKEGLTVFRDSEFSADMAAQNLTPTQAVSARAVRRIDSVRVLRAAQFPEDAGPMSHPIRPDSYQEIRNFYTATVYEKGAEVIRMIQTMLGVDGFRRGMDLYFARHDGQAVTCDEFVQAMFDANDRTGAEHFMRWYDTSGTPRVLVEEDWDASTHTYQLTFTQQISESSPSQLPLMIPIALGLINSAGHAVAIDHPLVVLRDWKTQVAFSVPEKPVPSLLRDFSAPVFLDMDYTDEQLLQLFAHDTDPFNRWEAGQRLMLGLMLQDTGRGINQHQTQILDAFRALLADPQLDNAYKAAVLTLPSEAYMAERVIEIDPAAIRRSRNQLRQQMAQHMRAELLQLDSALRTRADQPYSPDPLSTGRRSLANLAQHWLGLTHQLSPAELLSRFQEATNMTDRLATLQVLVELDVAESAAALDAYLLHFKHHDLALDKWFTVQATMLEDQGLDRVHALLEHPLFDETNPNRLRSLLGAFFHQNLPGFHRADGAGYALWAEQVLLIDRRNSQLASRMARALDRWARFEPGRREAMRRALEQVAADAKLSPDVREVVSKALS
jgi:aminopeptidase N